MTGAARATIEDELAGWLETRLTVEAELREARHALEAQDAALEAGEQSCARRERQVETQRQRIEEQRLALGEARVRLAEPARAIARAGRRTGGDIAHPAGNRAEG